MVLFDGGLFRSPFGQKSSEVNAIAQLPNRQDCQMTPLIDIFMQTRIAAWS